MENTHTHTQPCLKLVGVLVPHVRDGERGDDEGAETFTDSSEEKDLSLKNKYRMCECVYVLLFLVVGTCVSVTDLYARTYTKNTYM